MTCPNCQGSGKALQAGYEGDGNTLRCVGKLLFTCCVCYGSGRVPDDHVALVCPHCGSLNVRRAPSHEDHGVRLFECNDCDRSFCIEG